MFWGGWWRHRGVLPSVELQCRAARTAFPWETRRFAQAEAYPATPRPLLLLREPPRDAGEVPAASLAGAESRARRSPMQPLHSRQPRVCSSPVLAWAGGIKTTFVSPSPAAAGTPWVVCRAPAGWFTGKGENEEPHLGELFQLQVQQELFPGATSPRSQQWCVRNARAGPSYFCVKRLMEPNRIRAYLQGKHRERSPARVARARVSLAICVSLGRQYK